MPPLFFFNKPSLCAVLNMVVTRTKNYSVSVANIDSSSNKVINIAVYLRVVFIHLQI
jgi:hypothetical protein